MQSGLQIPRRNVIPELSYKCRRNLSDNLVPFHKGVGKLENLRLIRNRTEWAVYHAHAAGYALVVIDDGTSFRIRFNSADSAGPRTWTLHSRNITIRSGGFAFPALNTLFLVYVRFPVNKRNRTFRTYLHTGVSKAPFADIADLITPLFTCHTS